VTLREYLARKPCIKMALMWFDEDGNFQTKEFNKLSKVSERYLNMEVMECEEDMEDEEYKEIWVR
jgi:hypothetical protein